MADQPVIELFKKALLDCLEETFERVSGIYLDSGTSLFETLEGVSAEEASRPSPKRRRDTRGPGRTRPLLP